MSTQRISSAFPSHARKAKRPRMAAILAALAVLLYVAAAYLLLPRQLPIFVQRSLGLGCAGLAVAAFLLTTRSGESSQEKLRRLYRGRHSDFGRHAAHEQAKPHTVTLPLLGAVPTRSMGAIAVFLSVGGWWLTPWAPVSVSSREVEDLTIPFAEQIIATVLVMPNGQMAIPQAPAIPTRARELAVLIRNTKNSYYLGLKATAEGRFEYADALLAGATPGSDAESPQIFLARAQNAMFAGHFADATRWYQEGLRKAPHDSGLLCQAAVARLLAGEYAEAEPLIARALQACRDQGNDKPAAMGDCLHVQAIQRICGGKDFDSVGAMSMRALDIFQEVHGDSHVSRAASLNNQAVLYTLRGDYRGAESLLKGALDVWTAIRAPYSGRLNLGMLDYDLGRYGEAETQLKLAFKGHKDLPLEHDPLLPANLSAMAVLYSTLQRYPDAAADARRALDIVQAELGEEHPALVPLLQVLAANDFAQSLYHKAEKHDRRALALSKKTWGPSHPYTGLVLHALAALYLAQDRWAEAEPLCHQSLQIAQRTFGNQHVSTAAALATLGRLEIAQGRGAEGRAHLEEACLIDTQLLGESHPEVARLMGDLAGLDNSRAAYRIGVSEYTKAIAIVKTSLGPEHAEVTRLLVGLAALCTAQDKYAEADSYLNQALSIQETSLVSHHLDLASTLEARTAVLRKMEPANAQQVAAMEARAKSIRRQHAAADGAE
jgi:tetratricopeptide (TPR) repeat protein